MATTTEVPKRKHISFSEWVLFKNFCEHRWKLDVLEGRAAKAYSIHLDFGTSIHHALEHYKTKKDPVDLETAKKMFSEMFIDLRKKNVDKYAERDRSDESAASMLVSGQNILDGLSSCKEIWDAEVVWNEYELYVPIDRTDGTELHFKGFIDIVIKTKDKRGNTILYVCDFKTCSWGWALEKKQDKDTQAQLFLYKHFLCKKFNLDPKNVRCAFVLLKKKPRKNDTTVEFMPVSAGPVSVQRALDSINGSISRMRQGVSSNSLQKNKKSCTDKWGNTCPYLNTEHCRG